MDPMIQNLIDWLRGGDGLTGARAIAAVATVTRFVTVPFAKWAAGKLGQTIDDINTPVAASICGIVTLMAIGIPMHVPLLNGEMIATGIVAGLTAVGLHQTQEMWSEARKAKRDQKQMDAAVTKIGH